MTIFVAIASYRDPWLWRTVYDCLGKAEDPAALRFGIVEQSETPSQIDSVIDSQIRYLHCHHDHSRGACWARSFTYGVYQDEDYLLQIDSHMLFAPGWDRILINKLEDVSQPNPHSIISSYPYAFKEEDGKLKVDGHPGHAMVMRVTKASDFNNGSPVLSFEAAPIKTQHPVRGYHVAGGCLFTRGHFVHVVPYDPLLYFQGEEQNLAIRAWTHGWDIFHVPDLPVFHLYKKPDPKALVHWNAEDDAARIFRWHELQAIAYTRLKELLVEGKDLGIYGLGTTRSLAEFAKFSGIDYPNLHLERRIIPDVW